MKEWPVELGVSKIAVAGLITQNQHLGVQKTEVGTVSAADGYKETFAGEMVYKGGLWMNKDVVK